MNRYNSLALIALLIACSDEAPPGETPDAGQALDAGQTQDAGPVDSGETPSSCETFTDEISGACLSAELGAAAICPSGSFFSDHKWISQAAETQIIYVNEEGSGDGSTPETATNDPASVAGAGALILVLSKGEHDFALPNNDSLTLIGACAGETRLGLGVRGPVNRGAGQSLRLWGLTLSNSQMGEAGQLVAANGATTIEIRQTVLIAGDTALDLDSVADVDVQQNSFDGIGVHGIGVRGPLSGVIIGDNHFLGPLGGDGVFLGPLGGDGVFTVRGNQFDSLGGGALSVQESSVSGSIENNLINASVSGDGISLIGNSAGVEISVSGNRLNGMSGSGIMIAEGAAVYSITNNSIGAEGGLSDSGISLRDLTSPGSASLSANRVEGAQSIGIELLRNSGVITVQNNTIIGTRVGDMGPLDSDAAMAYGLAVFDSKSVDINNNELRGNETAALLVDFSDWSAYASRQDLSGPMSLNAEANRYDNNGGDQRLDFVLQNVFGELQRRGADEPHTPPENDLLPTSRSSRAFRCGNGQLDGAEECDLGEANGNEDCSANCRLRRGSPIALGDHYLCVTSWTGRVLCAGNNAQGQVDPSDSSSQIRRLRPRHDLPAGMLEISAGATAACSRGGDGKVHCWGNGQLGRGSQARQRQAAAPVKEGDEPMSGAKQISIGDTMGCAVLDTGALRCWGLGTLGDGSAPPRPYTQAVAVQLGASARPGDVVGPVENANKVALGRQFACYLNLEGEVFCWGQNDYGQLGISGDQVSGMGSCRSAQGSIHCSNHAVSLGIDGVSDLALGAAHACAIVDGGIVCWGSNESLQVRNDHTNEILQPTRLSGIEGAEALALGTSHSCARLSNSKIACWGANQHGQLGQTNLDAQNEIIARVRGPRNVELAQQRFVASGQHTACSLGPNGTLFCWGKMFVGNDQTGNARLITRLPR